MTATTTQLEQGGRLFDIAFASGGDGMTIDLLKDEAAVRLSKIDSEHATVLGTKVSEWPDRDLSKELEKALEIDPYMLLLQAWAKLLKVRKALDKSKLTDDPQTVALAKHEIDIKVEPSIVISAFKVDCREVKIALTLAAAFESVQLVFQRGALMQSRMGKPAGTLSLAIEGQPITSGKRELKFEPSIDFRPPLVIKALAGADQARP